MKHKAGYVSILGRPNVGKSTLLNEALGVKISITSPKAQTTRHRILGILSRQDYQILFMDTPGILHPSYLLQEYMMRAVEAATTDADILLYMVTASDRLYPDDESYLKALAQREQPLLVAINKVDLIQKGKMLPLMEEIHENYKPAEIIPISALNRDGLEVVIEEIVKRLPENPAFYPDDVLTEHPERFIVAEMIREQIFNQFTEEIPYSATVHIEDYHEQEDRKDVISAVIFVERESQKGIMIGKKGAALKKIGEEARKEIEAFLQRPVFLQLWVKVKNKWRSNSQAVRDFGYGPHLPRG